MKRTIIGAIVGALLIFIWQFLSWMVLNLHESSNRYTPNETVILETLAANLPEEGGYILPGMPPGASSDENKKLMEDMDKKPWASIQYHHSNKASSSDMIMAMLRGFLSNIIMVWLALWILRRFHLPRFSTVFFACLAIGLITFINHPYTMNIWFDTFDVWASLADSLVGWGLCGLWLGWWLNRRPAY